MPAAVAASLIFLGCGSPASGGSSSPAPSPDDAVSSDDNTGGNGPQRARAERREPDPSLVDPHPVSWDRSKNRGRHVTLYYYSGVKECYGLHHVKVRETSKKVTITLFDGRHRQAEACIELAVRVRTTVTLDEPLRNRKLVDGAP